MAHPQWTRRHALRAVASASALASTPLWAQDKEAAAGSNEIRLGQSAHLTGPLAPSFVPVLKGQDLAIEEVNRKGGINGRPIRLITLDDAYDAKKCVENVNTLIDND
ncbi:MAG TPA: ABC transporter substrate-binding protein, partial [Rhizobacter sp.]